MPLRDHFRPPLDLIASWDSFHGGWPMMIVQKLVRILPARYLARPLVHLGGSVEVDVGTFESESPEVLPAEGGNGNGGVAIATAVWAPPQPTLTLATEVPTPEEYEVRVYDSRRGYQLVAAIEIVSPANKNRPEHRRAFVAKCLALLQQRVSVCIIDLVTSRHGNLYAELLQAMELHDPMLGSQPPDLYAVACRTTLRENNWHLDNWYHPLSIGQPLPTLPLWLADQFALPLELEASYEETCQVLRMT